MPLTSSFPQNCSYVDSTTDNCELYRGGHTRQWRLLCPRPCWSVLDSLVGWGSSIILDFYRVGKHGSVFYLGHTTVLLCVIYSRLARDIIEASKTRALLSVAHGHNGFVVSPLGAFDLLGHFTAALPLGALANSHTGFVRACHVSAPHFLESAT